MNKYLKNGMSIGMLTLALVSCSTSKSSQDSSMNTYPMTYEEENTEYISLSNSEQQLVAQNNAFALNLFNRTMGMDSHILSPLSVTYLMSILANGAEGQTRSEILKTLGWDNDQVENVNALCRLLMEKSGKLDPAVTINIANYIALNKEVTLRTNYVKSIKEDYKAGVESLDFTNNKTTQHINDWCSKQTNGMIPSIVDRVDPSAVLYAMNAIFFNGTWADKFQKGQTREENFRGYTRDIKHVQMMHQNTEFLYFENDTMQAVSLPYGNYAYSMTVLLPRDGFSTTDIMKTLDNETINSLRYNMDRCVVDLKLPRFTTESQTDLNEVVSALGAPSMFTTSANFSSMCDIPLCVSKMLQKAKIEVSEEGTKAAAVTAAIMTMTSLNQPEPRRVNFHANHPFVYLITQHATGAILFIGQYTGN